MKRWTRQLLAAVSISVLTASMAAACGDDDASVEDATDAVRVDGSQLVIEIPAAAPSYVVTAEVPPGWNVAAAEPRDSEFDTQAWELVSAQDAVALTIYDVRNTRYDIANVEESLYEFTGDNFAPPRGVIGNTEEIEVTAGFPGFDLMLIDPDSMASGESNDEASMFVIALDGSFFITVRTEFDVDEETGGVAESAYSMILDTVTVVAR